MYLADQPIRLDAAAGELLDLHLSLSIRRYGAPEPSMRGMQRLANVMHSGLREMDDEAGAVADEFVAAKAESQAVIAGFKAHVGDIKAATAEVRSLLAQLTNGAAVGNSDGSPAAVGNGQAAAPQQ